MSRSIHSFHRYVGEKLYHAGKAARKAAMVIDNGTDCDVVPFWEAAPCFCMSATCQACRENVAAEEQENRWLADYEEHTQLLCQAAQWQPQPPACDTGHLIHVEWEMDRGGRYWTWLDEGQLNREIWLMLRGGCFLSDIEDSRDALAA